MILPSPGPDTEVYWQAAREGRLLLKYCQGCGSWLHPRESQCCGGMTPMWRRASGRGTLLSYTVVRYELNPALAGRVPYTITLTRTDEGPQLLTSLPNDGWALAVGEPMVVIFDRVTETVTLPRFAPVDQTTHH